MKPDCGGGRNPLAVRSARRDRDRVHRYPKSIALAAGFASATGFAPLGLWPVTLVCLAVLMALVAAASNWRGAFMRGWLFGVGHFTLGLNWIAHAFDFQDAMPHWLGYGAVVVLSLYLAVYPGVAGLVAWLVSSPSPSGERDSLAQPSRVRETPRVENSPSPWRFAPVAGRSRPARPWTAGGSPTSNSPSSWRRSFILAFAAAWIITEYLRATLFTGFAWNPLGVVALSFMTTASVAQLTGTYGLSGLLVLAAAMIWLLVERRASRWTIVGTALAVLLIAVSAELSPWTLPPTVRDARPLIRIVQHNLSQADRHDAAHDEESVLRLERLTGPPIAEPRLILWPEAAVPYFLEEEHFARDRLAKLLGPRDVLLTGGDALIYDPAGKLVAARNSVFMLMPGGLIVARYDKAHLVPYGEYLPMRPLLSRIGLARLVPGDLDFIPGPGPQTLSLPGFGKVGVQTCYEITFSGQVVDREHRPDFIFNPSTDAWFGAWGPPQHLAQARLRAIEEGLPVVRSTPTGISAVIDADGRLIAALPLGKAGFLTERLPPPHAPTLFARYGNALPLALALLLAILAVAPGVRRRYGRT